MKGQKTASYLQETGYLLKQQVLVPPSPKQQFTRTRFGQYIQSARQYHGLSRVILAAALGVTEAEVYGLEQGLLPTVYIGKTLLPGLAKTLDEDLALLTQLLGEECYDRKVLPVLSSLPGWWLDCAFRCLLCQHESARRHVHVKDCG